MTEQLAADPQVPAAAAGGGTHTRHRGGPDRITIGLLAITAFLLVLALLGSQLTSPSGGQARRREVVVRRVYRTTVLERVLPAGSGPKAGASVTQSGSPMPAAEPAAPAPVTRVS
jgi:hypothetical protein